MLGLNEKIEAFAPEDFSQRSLPRAHYGVLLANIGDFSRAAKFLDLGEKANLLPEEKKLVEKAQLTVARR